MSTEVLVKIDQGRAVGLTGHDAEALSELEGGEYRCVLTTPRGRSAPQSNVFHDLCGKIAANYDPVNMTKDNVRETITIEAGHCTVSKMADGTWRRNAKSIAFAKMDQDEFNVFLERAIDAATTLFGADLTLSCLNEALRLSPSTTAAKGNLTAVKSVVRGGVGG